MAVDPLHLIKTNQKQKGGSMFFHRLKGQFRARWRTEDGDPIPAVWVVDDGQATLVNPDSGRMYAYVRHDGYGKCYPTVIVSPWRALHLLRQLAGGGVMQLPSSAAAELNNPETGPDIRRYIRSTGIPSEERIKLFKLAWDLFGSEFGGRHHQYEMFYAGAPFVAKGYAFRNYGFDDAVALVDEFMSSYSLEPAAEAVRA